MSRAAFFFIALTFFSACKSTIAPIERTERPNRALLLIDLQRGVLDPAGPASIDPARSEALIQAARREILAAQNEKLPVIFIKNEWPAWRFAENWWFGGAFKKDSEWAQIDPRLLELVPEHERIILSKAFPSSFTNETLQAELKKRQIGELWVGGLFADKCVTATSQDALENGYSVMLLPDTLVTQEPKDLPAAIENLQKKGATVKLLSASAP